ncbi:HNH endonuclease [Lonepinella sp. BR2474]|uniref:HNH endonuclease n=1 Tax=Lonepinella sp. BR2474 TaxID=3434548 RepID=UPI003F6E0F5A
MFVDSFFMPNSIVDEYMSQLSDQELRIVTVYYRYCGVPPDEVLEELGVSEDIFNKALYECGILSDSYAKELLKDMIDEYSDVIKHFWRYGDGYGSEILEVISNELDLDTRYKHRNADNIIKPKKQKIPNRLRKQVFERDEYRCVSCGTHLDLTCDHIHPESKGGETTLDNLQTMCRSCNSRKGTKVEIQ